jgi:phospholipid/cholesterol/gamma-HCH transport system permease protein
MRLLALPFIAFRNSLGFIGGWGFLLRDTALATPKALLAKRGRRLGWRNLWFQMDRLGVRSIPIVSLVMFCVGSIVALQMAPTMDDYGIVERVADIIAVSVYRELGPLLSAIVLTGFAGASIAAELGTMVVSEEVQALEAGAIPPIRFLVLPRVLATIIMTVCITVVGDITGTLGGLVVGTGFLKMGFHQYLTYTRDALAAKDFITGLVKAGVFGLIISSLACFLGLRVTGGAMGVGVATTRTVVLTIVALIAVDLLFTAFFFFLHL